MRYARNPEVLWRSTSAGPVLLAPSHSQPERLGGTAAVVWEVLDQPLTEAEVAIQVSDLAGATIDVQSAIRELERLELLVPAS